MKYSLRSLMIGVTLVCIGLAAWIRYQQECDGVVLLKGKPAYDCSIYFWRPRDKGGYDTYTATSDSLGRYTLRDGDRNRAPAGRYFVGAYAAQDDYSELWRYFERDNDSHYHVVTTSRFGVFSRRIPDIDFAKDDFPHTRPPIRKPSAPAPNPPKK